MNCHLCPINCGRDRAVTRGACKSKEEISIARAALHFWEEPCISGKKGSGAVFFTGCNLSCRFCQNYEISSKGGGAEISVKRLADLFLYLQDEGAANVNLVTPSHYSDKIAEALEKVKSRLFIPVVYNTNSYEYVTALARLDQLVDVYLPDLKFYDPQLSAKLSGAANYFTTAFEAFREMKRQQPNDVFDEDGYIKKGVIVRVLALPAHIEDAKKILDELARFDNNVYVSLMAQYFPPRKDLCYPELNRRLYKREYASLKDYFFNVGLKNGYMQSPESATEDYVPSFDFDAVKRTIDNLPEY